MPSSDGNGASAQRYISYGPRIARIFPIPALSPHAMMPAAFLLPTPTTFFLSGSRTGLAGDRTRAKSPRLHTRLRHGSVRRKGYKGRHVIRREFPAHSIFLAIIAGMTARAIADKVIIITGAS